MALDDARGRLAHQMWSVDMCPCRMFFSFADKALTSLTGKDSSIKRLSLFTFRFLCLLHRTTETVALPSCALESVASLVVQASRLHRTTETVVLPSYSLESVASLVVQASRLHRATGSVVRPLTPLRLQESRAIHSVPLHQQFQPSQDS